VWSEGPSAQLTLPIDARVPGQLRIALQLGAFVAPGSEQRIHCSLNGIAVAEWQLQPGEAASWRQLRIPPPALEAARNSQHLLVRFQIESPASPQSLGLNSDTRQLGVALQRVQLSVVR
jgi:hypothetical protein